MTARLWTIAGLALVVLFAFARKGSAMNRASSRSASFAALAESIGVAEGYGLAGAIPTVRNNPGDLKLPGSNGQVTTFANPEEGWDALYRQLDLIRTGQSAYYNPDMTIFEMARVWTTTQQDAWGGNVVRAMNDRGYPVTLNTRLAEIL